MKKQLLTVLLLAFTAVSSMAQTVGDAIYIYRNDGEFNAFLREEIDSIAYSYYDADSIRYEEIVTQLIYAGDSLYRIPVAVIDSVSFVQPEAKYQPNVLRMDDGWLPYVIKVGETSITFRSTTPASLLPQKDQVIVAETFEPPFDTGFSGRVSRITNYADSIVFEVESVRLSDIYEHLVSVGFSSSYNELEPSPVNRRRIYGENFKSGVKFPLPNLDFNIGTVSVSCSPTVVLKYILCVGEKNLKNYANIMFNHSYSGSVGYNLKVEGEYKPEPIWKAFIPIATSIPGVYGKIKFGGFIRASGSAQLSATQPFLVTGVSGFVYSEDNGLKGINKWNSEPRDPEISISIDGSVSAGVAIRTLFGVVHEKIASADVTAYLGPKLSGHFGVTSEGIINKTLYSSIKDSHITLSLAADVIPGYRWIGEKEHKEIPFSLNCGKELTTWDVVPGFSNLSWSPDKTGFKGILKGNISSRTLLTKVALGWGIYDEKDNLYKSVYLPATYRKIEDWPYNGIEYALTEKLPYGAHYKAYPLVKLFGVEMRADQSVDISSDVFVETRGASDITTSEAKLAGYVEGLEYGQVVDAGIAYSLNQNSENWTKASANRREDGEYTVTLKDLQSDKKYYYQAYAYSDGEYYYGETKSFQTEKELEVTTLDASSITDKSAMMSGKLENYKTDKLTGYGIAYGTSAGSMQKVSASGLAVNGTFSVAVKGLKAETTYYYQAFGIQDGKEYAGQTLSFKTEKKDPEDPEDPDDPDNPDNPDDPDDPDNPDDPDTPDDLDELLTHLCPDGNHPHMIDLGLPSGTKWACCNVGANKPEDCGGYYYWGETEEKDVYFYYYYKYYVFSFDDEGYLADVTAIPIGEDIAGTAYDVASAKWGGSWQMPTKDQIKELTDMVNSMREEGKIPYGEKTYHGMNGMVIKGTSGNAIFFPYAGAYPAENVEGFPLQGKGELGAYWTSTRYDESTNVETNESAAYFLGFKNNGGGLSIDLKVNGLTVRPVCK